MRTSENAVNSKFVELFLAEVRIHGFPRSSPNSVHLADAPTASCLLA